MHLFNILQAHLSICIPQQLETKELWPLYRYQYISIIGVNVKYLALCVDVHDTLYHVSVITLISHITHTHI